MKRIHSVLLPAVCLLSAALLALLRVWQLREDGLPFWALLLAVAAAVPLWLFSSRLLPAGDRLSGVKHPSAGLLFLLGGLLLAVFNARSLLAHLRDLQDILGLLSDLLGLAAAFSCCVLGAAALGGKAVSPLLRSVIYVFLMLRLISCFRIWTMDPVIPDYCFQHFGLILATLALYGSTSLAFGKGHRRLTVFWCMAGTGLCAMATCDVPLRESLLYFGLCLVLFAQQLQILTPLEALPAAEIPAD